MIGVLVLATRKKKTSRRKAASSTPVRKTRSASASAKKTASAKKRKAAKPARKKAVAKKATAGPKRGRSKKAATTTRKKAKTVSRSTPRKTARGGGGMSPEDLAHFRGLLLEKRAELVGDVANLRREAFRRNGNNGSHETSAMPTHMADAGSDQWEQEFTLGLLDKDVALLREIDEALERIDNGTYGRCMATNKRILKPRLRAMPWAKYCIDYVRQLEQRRFH